MAARAAELLEQGRVRDAWKTGRIIDDALWYELVATMTDMPSRVVGCSACGKPAEGHYSVHRDGFDEGPEVPICDACAAPMEEGGPTLAEIWAAIRVRRRAKVTP